MKRFTMAIGLALLALHMVLATPARGQAQDFPGPLTRQLQMNCTYVKETTDRAWKLRIVGKLPRGPGAYAIVYDEGGQVIKHQEVPFGTYDETKPFTITVPADGKAQQYVIKLIAQQDNLNGMSLPLTDLPYEVYGDFYYSMGQGTGPGQKRVVAFQVADDTPLHLQGWRSNFRVLDAAGQTLFDSAKDAITQEHPEKKTGPNYVEMIVTLKPGQTYWMEPYGVMYWARINGNLYVTFDPKRWFAPTLSWTLKDRPWWKGMP